MDRLGSAPVWVDNRRRIQGEEEAGRPEFGADAMVDGAMAERNLHAMRKHKVKRCWWLRH